MTGAAAFRVAETDGGVQVDLWRPAAQGTLRLVAEHLIWAAQILADLERPHPDIRQVTTRLDCFRNGHAMVRPLPGLIWGEAGGAIGRRQSTPALRPCRCERILPVRGGAVPGGLAAERTLSRLGWRFTSSLS